MKSSPITGELVGIRVPTHLGLNSQIADSKFAWE